MFASDHSFSEMQPFVVMQVTKSKFNEIAQAKRCPLQEQILCIKVHFIVSNDALNDCIDDIFIIFVKKKCYLIFFLLETGLKFREENRLKKAKTGSKKRKTEDVAKESKD